MRVAQGPIAIASVGAADRDLCRSARAACGSRPCGVDPPWSGVCVLWDRGFPCNFLFVFRFALEYLFAVTVTYHLRRKCSHLVGPCLYFICLSLELFARAAVERAFLGCRGGHEYVPRPGAFFCVRCLRYMAAVQVNLLLFGLTCGVVRGWVPACVLGRTRHARRLVPGHGAALSGVWQ